MSKNRVQADDRQKGTHLDFCEKRLTKTVKQVSEASPRVYPWTFCWSIDIPVCILQGAKGPLPGDSYCELPVNSDETTLSNSDTRT